MRLLECLTLDSKAFRHCFGDRLDPDGFVCGVSAGLAVELAHVFAAGMMQSYYLPIRRFIEYRAAGAARFRRRAIVDEASLRLARCTGGWAFVIKQLVILQRKRKLPAFGMANYVDALVIVERRQAFGDRARRDALNRRVEPQQAGVEMLLG